MTRQGDPVRLFDDRHTGAIVRLGIGSNRRLTVSLAGLKIRSSGDTTRERRCWKEEPGRETLRQIHRRRHSLLGGYLLIVLAP